MESFWEIAIEPILDALEPHTIVEVGTADGGTTSRLLRWTEGRDAIVHSIDPSPALDADEWRLRHPGQLELHEARSLEVLPRIESVDAVLIDGDHNWYTVFNELQQIADTARRREYPLPLIFIHDVGWPYARRDMYYDLRSVPEEHRQQATKQAVRPGDSSLGFPGLNPSLWNASCEGGPKNGVLTAVEDFVRFDSAKLELRTVDGMHGLGILFECDRVVGAPKLAAALTALDGPEALREQVRRLEQARIEAKIDVVAARRQIAALSVRADELEADLSESEESLAQRQGEIEDLERQLRERRARGPLRTLLERLLGAITFGSRS